MNDLREGVNELLAFVGHRLGMPADDIGCLMVGADETDKLANRLKRFREAWFPDTDASLVLPSKLTAPVLLAVSLYSLIVPRLALLPKPKRSDAVPQKGNGLDMAPVAQAVPDAGLPAGLEPFA